MHRIALSCTFALLITFISTAQFRQNDGLKPRRRFTFLLGAVSYGPLFMTNKKLDHWLINNGATPRQPKFRSEFLRFAVSDQRWVLGLGLSIAATGGKYAQNIVDCDFTIGRHLYHKGRFTTIINSKFGFLLDRINGVVPTSITTPHTNSHLEGFGLTAGASLQTLFRVRQGKKANMYLGVEYGISWITRDKWQYGYNTPTYRGSHFHGVDIPEVPYMANHYGYVNLSIYLGLF